MFAATTQKVIRIAVVIFITIVLFIGMRIIDGSLGIFLGKWMAWGSMLFVAFLLAKAIMNKLLHDDVSGGITFTRIFSLIK